MANEKKKLVTRAKKVAYFGVPGATVIYTRMKNFTSMSKSSNPKEYSRQYVDEENEETDITGFSPSIAYGFDLYMGNPVHEDIVGITDGEKLGDDAVRSIIIVDFTSQGEADNTYKAIKREYAVIPDAEGDGTDAYTYSGNFKCKSAKTEILVSVSADQLTITEVPSGVSEAKAVK